MTSILKYKTEILKNVSSKWMQIIDNETLDRTLSKIKTPKMNLCPSLGDIFKFTRCTNLNRLKIIIIGMNPHFNDQESLKTIYRCLRKQNFLYKGNQCEESTANFSFWENQGVLLLDRCLTTESGKVGTHIKEWKPYTKELIELIQNKLGRRLIFMLWGKKAHTCKKFIKKENITMEWGSSPQRGPAKEFIHCDHFKESNRILIENNELPIIWDPRIKIMQSNIRDTENDISSMSNDGTKYYEYVFQEIFKFYYFDKNSDIVFTDGSSYKNRAGFSLVYLNGNIIKKQIKNDITINNGKSATNIRSEGSAIMLALRRLENGKKLLIVTDSKFWIDMIYNYMPMWYKMGGHQTFEDKKNPDLTIPLFKLVKDIINDKSKLFTFLHVYSHNKSGWRNSPSNSIKGICYTMNNKADKLANEARLES